MCTYNYSFSRYSYTSSSYYGYLYFWDYFIIYYSIVIDTSHNDNNSISYIMLQIYKLNDRKNHNF